MAKGVTGYMHDELIRLERLLDRDDPGWRRRQRWQARVRALMELRPLARWMLGCYHRVMRQGHEHGGSPDWLPALLPALGFDVIDRISMRSDRPLNGEPHTVVSVEIVGRLFGGQRIRRFDVDRVLLRNRPLLAARRLVETMRATLPQFRERRLRRLQQLRSADPPPCPECDGIGSVYLEHESAPAAVCSACSGSGYASDVISEVEALVVNHLANMVGYMDGLPSRLRMTRNREENTWDFRARNRAGRTATVSMPFDIIGESPARTEIVQAALRRLEWRARLVNSTGDFHNAEYEFGLTPLEDVLVTRIRELLSLTPDAQFVVLEVNDDVFRHHLVMTLRVQVDERSPFTPRSSIRIAHEEIRDMPRVDLTRLRNATTALGWECHHQNQGMHAGQWFLRLQRRGPRQPWV